MKLKKLIDRFKLWWTINLFRFCVSIGKAPWAQKFLDRISLPVHALDEAAFQYREKQLWGKYIDLHGKVRLFTWKGFFNSLMIITVTGIAVFVLISAHGNLTRKIDTLKSQLQIESTTSQKSESPESAPIAGNSPQLVTEFSPLFSNGKLYFPTTFKVGPVGTVYYAVGDTFGGESRILEDCRIAIKLRHTDGYPLYYVYSPGFEIQGIWVDQSGMTDLEATIDPGTGIKILPRNKLSRKLRDGPSSKSEVIQTIPDGKGVEFIRFASVSSISTKIVWALVKYTMETGQCVRGWIPILSFNIMYVKVENGSDTVEVTDQTGLTFRNESGDPVAKIGNLTKIPYGARAKFIKFASLNTLISGKSIRIQVQYIDTGNTGEQASGTYTVWVNAGAIKDKFIALEGTPGESLKPTGELKADKEGGNDK